MRLFKRFKPRGYTCDSFLPIRISEGVSGIYFAQTLPSNFIKIGMASDIKRRIQTLRTAQPFELNLIAFVATDDYAQLEKHYHQLFERYHYHREWYYPGHELKKLVRGLGGYYGELDSVWFCIFCDGIGAPASYGWIQQGGLIIRDDYQYFEIHTICHWCGEKFRKQLESGEL